ncbi:hypothetical protein BV20DRAFT_1037195 [Pilatotrama ljubarskyi]|nr:hypothetical protein BV20DRAFT_1037195 [Pilatotrama ljubarskyi]
MQSEELLHDRVNLARLVRRLEKTVCSEAWLDEVAGFSPTPTWITTRRTLQKVKHARKLLQSVEYNEASHDSSALRRYDDYRKILDRLESIVAEADKRYPHRIARPEPILHTIPPPPVVAEAPSVEPAEDSLDPSTTLLPAEPTPAVATHELLLTPSESEVLPRGPINPSEALLPPSLPVSTEKSTSQAAPAFLQNSAALHEELSAQLAQMATQLKRNAVHFAESLEKDKAVVQETQEKLERNHDVMSKERVRLRDHRSKSWGTTWITMLSIVVALIGFIVTFLIIRVT